MNKKDWGIIILLLLCIFGVWTQQRTRPFIGHDDWDNIIWVSAAKNYQRYGIIDTKLAQILNPYPTSDENWVINSHHPPGISLITYASINAFGDSEFVARMTPIWASLLAAALLYRFTRQLYGNEMALLALFFFGFTPSMVYTSAKIGHEQYTLPLMLLSLNLLLRPSHYRQQTLIFIGLAGGIISWAWYLFVGLVGLYSWRNFKSLKNIQGLGVGTAISLCLLGILYITQSDSIAQLWDGFMNRTANTSDYPVNWVVILNLVTRFFWLPTPVVTLFALLWLRTNKPSLEAIVALTALIYNAVFWQASLTHDYLLYYLFAPLSIWGALGFHQLLYRYGRPPQRLWGIIHVVLLGLFLLGSYRWSSRLFANDVIPRRYEWGIQARHATEEGEIIVTNLVASGPHISYYANREVLFEKAPEEVFNLEHPLTWGFYIYCVDQGDKPAEQLMEYPYTIDQNKNIICYLVDLNPDARP
ncbi:MAG: glycosyltransferase family 39 protein [Pseudomonadales bacterium]|nr:glycosyltransferase family 39 protein [Pseudomonadales bacterium]